MARRQTYAEITHRVIDESAKPEVVYTMTDLFAWADLDQIKDDVQTVDSDTRATPEHNNWLADGTKQITPDDYTEITWGLWSDSRTDAAGDFAVPPMLQATFASTHTTSGIMFYFAGDTTPKTITLEWRQGATLLASETYTVTAFKFFAKRTVVGFNDLRIYFNDTRVPERRVKVAEIDFGQTVTWGKTNLIRARLTEETDPTASQLILGGLDFEVYDPTDDFNILNPQSAYAALRENQKLTVVEFVNDVPAAMGEYYLVDWDSPTPSKAIFAADNALTFLAAADYKTSLMWNAATVTTIAADIFGTVGWTNYTIDAAIAAETLSGYIPVTDCRDALHQLCIACRAVVIVKRDGSIWITRLPSAGAAAPVELTEKMGGPTVRQRPYKNSVAVTGYSFLPEANTTTLYTQAHTAGTYEVTFSRPVSSLAPTNATIVASGVNWCKFTVASSVTVTFTGKYYTPTGRLFTVEDVGLTTANRAQATVEHVYLMSAANAQTVAQFLYDWYQHRTLQKFTIRMDGREIGDNLDVATSYGTRKTGVLTRAAVDLTGGYLGECEVIG